MPALRAGISQPRCACFSAARRVHCRMKPDQPELKTANIIVNGEIVGETEGILDEYHVDVWAGNHPFYQGTLGNMVMDEGQVNKFKDKFAGQGMDWMSDVATLSGGGGGGATEDEDEESSSEEEPEPAPAPPPQKGKKGKKK